MRERISIHAPHEGERPDGADNITDLAHISIHAPHEGERPSSAAFIASYRSISIHAPHEGERLVVYIVSVSSCTDFNPRSPRGGATEAHNVGYVMGEISIHAPHEGERRSKAAYGGRETRFQSTLPTRGSDLITHPYTPTQTISIHAPHEGERQSLTSLMRA